MTVLLGPEANPGVQPPQPTSVITRIMKAFRAAAKFAYDLLNDLF